MASIGWRHIVSAVVGMASAAAMAKGQGCVAAHSAQPTISGLTGIERPASSNHLHGLTVTLGFREFNSKDHYVGTVYQVQRALLKNRVQNHEAFYDLSMNYQLTHRWSLTADVPFLSATRHQEGSQNFYKSGGIGDMQLGAQAWVFRPPTENKGNVAINAALKLPTGINDAKGTTHLANGTSQVRPFDESIQPGDGTWGFSLGTVAYHPLPLHTIGYFTGSWLFSPQATTGVQTFRSLPGEQLISATDQYLWRGGVSRNIPRVRGLALSAGGRMEGVPVRDAIGSSAGFRRPGYIISFEPGLMYDRRGYSLNVSAPWAIERNRKRSINDIAAGPGVHGDAAFSDYTVIASVSKTF